jgi:hypothetical protein
MSKKIDEMRENAAQHTPMIFAPLRRSKQMQKSDGSPQLMIYIFCLFFIEARRHRQICRNKNKPALK